MSETVDQGRAAPRFVLVRTSEGPLCRVRNDAPEDLAEALITHALAEPPLGDDPDVAPACDVQVTMLLSPIDRTGGGPFYAFPGNIGPDAHVVEVTSENRHLVPDLEDYEFPCFAAVVDGGAVSVCRTARLVDRAAQAGVNTEEPYRGKGYGPRVAFAWARAIRKTGREPIYSTSYENIASRRSAQGAGLKLMGADWNVY